MLSDEAALHYVAAVDQTTLGHRFISEEFDGYKPRVGWQIDPFGHSNFNALLDAEAGFDSLFFARNDYQDKAQRVKDRTLEMLWRPSPSAGKQQQIFTGIFAGGYGPFPNFCFDQHCSDPPIQDDPRLNDMNVKDRVNLFVNISLTQAQGFSTNNLMFLAGSDFQHVDSLMWYRNLDKIIHYVNLDGRVNAFYSTPGMYTDAVHATNTTFTTKSDDFFPYADCPHCYWTGYFTSRPALKRYVRVSSAYLNVARQMDGVLNRANGSALELFAEAVGVCQHHDAVSGTSKQHTAYDYAQRLARGGAIAENLINGALGSWTVRGHSDTEAPMLQQCPLANVSVCAASATGKAFSVIAYNPLSRERSEYARVPVSTATVKVTNATGGAVEAQVTTNGAHTAGAAGAAPYTAVFRVDLPALGFSTYFVAPGSSSADSVADAEAPARGAAAATEASAVSAVPRTLRGSTDQSIENDLVTVTFDGTSGRMKSITNKQSGVTIAVTADFVWYNSSAYGKGWGDEHNHQNSGAYIFRPNGTEAFPVNAGAVTTTVSNGAVVSEAVQVFADWLKVTVRLYAGSDNVETEYTVGPVPIDDDMGKEVIARYTTDLTGCNQTFYTDSNGREFVERRVNYRPTWKLNVTEPVAGNFYPVNAAYTLKDDARQLAILVDRSQAGGMVANAAAELMVHRRILFDDSRGVGEPLNETTSITPYPNPKRLGTGLIITGKHYLQVTKPAGAFAAMRPQMDAIFQEPVLAYGAMSDAETPESWTAAHAASASMLAEALPTNVMLMTVEGRPGGKMLLRFAHQFAVGEDADMSKPATVKLGSLFADLKIAGVQELSLTANQPRSDVKRLLWKTTDEPDPQPMPVPTPPASPDWSFTIEPMAFRTFEVTLA